MQSGLPPPIVGLKIAEPTLSQRGMRDEVWRGK